MAGIGAIGEVSIGGYREDPSGLLGGGAHVPMAWEHAHKEKELAYSYPYQSLAKKREELKSLEEKISEASAREEILQQKLSVEENIKQLKKLAALEAKAQEEIRQLLAERLLLIRLIDDEESILVILCSMPFIR